MSATKKMKKNFLAFFKAEKSTGEISLCENLTAMCEWAIWNDSAARQNSSKAHKLSFIL